MDFNCMCDFGAIQKSLRNVGREVDRKGDEKWHKRESVCSKKVILEMFLCSFFFCYSIFRFGSSRGSGIIAVSNIKNTPKKLYVCLR